MGALKKETFVPMAFFKKEAYTGSFKGMRYRVVKAETSSRQSSTRNPTVSKQPRTRTR